MSDGNLGLNNPIVVSGTGVVSAQSANTLDGRSPVSHYQLLKMFNFVCSN